MINTQHGFLEFSIVIINPDTRSLAHLLPLKKFQWTNKSFLYFPVQLYFLHKKQQQQQQKNR